MITRSTALVLLACSLPIAGILLLGDPLPLDARGDALAHAAAGAWLSWLAFSFFDLRGGAIVTRGVPLALGVALASELAQAALTRARTAGIEDLVADAFGVALAALVRATATRRLRLLGE